MKRPGASEWDQFSRILFLSDSAAGPIRHQVFMTTGNFL